MCLDAWLARTVFLFTIHTEVHLSYAVLRLPRNKCQFLLKKNEIFKKENTKLSTKHTKYLLNGSQMRGIE